MKTNLDILDEAYNKHKDSFSANFHTALWRILVSNVHEGKIVAFTPNYNKLGLQLGLAFANEPGFFPLSTYFDEDVKWDVAADVCEDLNKIIFKFDDYTASNIVASSMRLP